MRKVLEQCPSCQSSLNVTRLECDACGTIILGRYEPCRFCSLSPENLRLLETFVKCRGNVKEMERELDVHPRPFTVDGIRAVFNGAA